jgi:hypothetical protein
VVANVSARTVPGQRCRQKAKNQYTRGFAQRRPSPG